MDMTVENILIMVAAVPGLYGFLCWVRRSVNAHKAASWVKDEAAVPDYVTGPMSHNHAPAIGTGLL